MFHKFFHRFDPDNSSHVLDVRKCGSPGCAEEGKYRAPKSRQHIESQAKDWYWFCLPHIRDYNRQWDYYANMTETEIERERREDVTGQRPSWPMGMQKGYAGSGGNRKESPFPYHASFHRRETFQDTFNLFKDSDPSFSASRLFKEPVQSPETKAMKVLGLSFPWCAQDLQKRYRELVKKHHPDANGGSAEAEEAIKNINGAYRILKGNRMVQACRIWRPGR